MIWLTIYQIKRIVDSHDMYQNIFGHKIKSVSLATNTKPLSNKISFRLVRVCTFQCVLARIMEKILFCLVAENVYDTDSVHIGDTILID